MEPSTFIDFQKNFFGFGNLAVNTDGRWVASNMPAFNTEPFMNSYKNYITRFEFDIQAIKQYGGFFLPITNSWEDVGNFLYENGDFKDALAGSTYLNEPVKQIKSSNKTPEGQLKAAFELIKQIKWNNWESLYPSNPDLNIVFKKRVSRRK